MSAAEIILRKLLDKVIEELQYKHADVSVKELTSGGANYTSALYSATITSPDKENLKLFAKVANISGKFRKAVNLDMMFSTEQFVYSHLIKVYEEIQDKYVSPEHRYVFPKFFGGQPTEGEETVIMEDLTAKNYGTYSRFKSLDWEHAASAVECLAKFHALSFAYRKEDPDNFDKDALKVKFKMEEKPEDSNMAETWKKMMGTAIQVAKEEHRDRLAKFLAAENNREEFYKFKKPLSVPVLCHGDYRVSNLLFRRQNDRLETIVVDFQTVHSGCPTTDLLYLEFMGTDQEFRREYHERLIDHYFTELTVALDKLQIDVNEVYPRETFENELKEMMGPALRMAAIILPLVLVEAEQAPHMGGISGIEDFALSPSQLFAERYSDIVSDCVNWGVI